MLYTMSDVDAVGPCLTLSCESCKRHVSLGANIMTCGCVFCDTCWKSVINKNMCNVCARVSPLIWWTWEQLGDAVCRIFGKENYSMLWGYKVLWWDTRVKKYKSGPVTGFKHEYKLGRGYSLMHYRHKMRVHVGSFGLHMCRTRRDAVVYSMDAIPYLKPRLVCACLIGPVHDVGDVIAGWCIWLSSRIILNDIKYH